MSSTVFISWSGELSKKLAEEIRIWLPCVLPHIKPYFTPEDIKKGVRWETEIKTKLEDSDVGIICLTKDNINAPWILFEAGALSKKMDKTSICPILFNLRNADLEGPLTAFQTTLFDKNDFKVLLTTINNNTNSDIKLETNTLNKIFEKWWPDIEKNINEILKNHVNTPYSSMRNEREILEEILELTRLNANGIPIQKKDVIIKSVHELINVITYSKLETVKLFNSYGIKDYSRLDEYRNPIEKICMELDAPDLYASFILKNKQFLKFNEKKV